MPSRYYGLAVLFAVLLVLFVFTASAWWMSRGRDWWTERQWRKENMRANERYAAFILNRRQALAAVRNGRTVRESPRKVDALHGREAEAKSASTPRSIAPLGERSNGR